MQEISTQFAGGLQSLSPLKRKVSSRDAGDSSSAPVDTLSLTGTGAIRGEKHSHKAISREKEKHHTGGETKRHPAKSGTSTAGSRNSGKTQSLHTPSGSSSNAPGTLFIDEVPFSLEASSSLQENLKSLVEGEPRGRSGRLHNLGNGAVERQRVVTRHIIDPEQGEGIEICFRLAPGKHVESAVSRMKESGAREHCYIADLMKEDPNGLLHIRPESYSLSSSGLQLETLRRDYGWYAPEDGLSLTLREPGRYQVDLQGNDALACFRGQTRIRVFGSTPAERLKNAEEAVSRCGIEPALTPATGESRERRRLLQLLWQRDHVAFQKLCDGREPEKVSPAEIRKCLRKAGVSGEEIKGARLEEVLEGYSTAVDPSQEKKYRDLGVEYLFTGLPSLEAVINTIKSDGVLSTHERLCRGLEPKGKSWQQDLENDGGDCAFAALVTQKAKGLDICSDTACYAGQYQLLYDTGLLNRTDWWANSTDRFGHFYGNYGGRLIDEIRYEMPFEEYWEQRQALEMGYQAHVYYPHNEVMFPVGISNRHMTGIATQSEKWRQDLLDALKKEGISEINGQPIERFVIVKKKLL